MGKIKIYRVVEMKLNIALCFAENRPNKAYAGGEATMAFWRNQNLSQSQHLRKTGVLLNVAPR